MLCVHLPPEEGEGWKLGAVCEHRLCPFVVGTVLLLLIPAVQVLEPPQGWEVLSDLTELCLAGT